MPGMNRGDNLEEIYAWIDEIPFYKLKKNIPREFSDGVLMAELLKIHYPRFADVHNYIPASNVAAKRENWNTLNRKVFTKIDMKLGKDVINQLANSQPGIIEKLLVDLWNKILIKDSSFGGEKNERKIDVSEQNLVGGKNERENTETDRKRVLKLIKMLNFYSLNNENVTNVLWKVGMIQKDEKTISPELLSNAVAKSSSSYVSVTKSTRNLIQKACGWLVSWIWPFSGSLKATEKELSSSSSGSAGVESLEKSCSVTEQPIPAIEGEEEDEEASGISRLDFLRLRQEVEKKGLAIGMLNRKVSCLESAMKLKDQKIGNLAAQISTPNSTETAQNLRPRVIGSSISRLRSAAGKNFHSVS